MYQKVTTTKIRKWKEMEFDQKEVSKGAQGLAPGKRLCPWQTAGFA